MKTQRIYLANSLGEICSISKKGSRACICPALDHGSYWREDVEDCFRLAAELNRHARKSPNGRA